VITARLGAAEEQRKLTVHADEPARIDAPPELELRGHAPAPEILQPRSWRADGSEGSGVSVPEPDLEPGARRREVVGTRHR